MLYEITKRIIDIVGSIILLILFSPVIIITTIVIKLSSKGPVLADIPKRVGRNGKLFRLYKFRSMIVNAHSLIRRDPRFKKLYEEYKKTNYKLHSDPRVTPIGRFIRKYSIDEIPQFVNVLRGEMSIVGPRAYFPDELKQQTKRYPQSKKYIDVVLSVRPGITGFWQVTGRSEINFDKRFEMDATYARKKSIWFDLMILLKTPWAMISGKGAV